MTAVDIFGVFLTLNALVVAAGLVRKKNMWPFIALYWMILFVRNAVDMLQTA